MIELTQRDQIVLEAVITDYIETGEPVGSRTISKRSVMNVSPATIRNVMADLEEMGLAPPAAHIGGSSSDRERACGFTSIR